MVLLYRSGIFLYTLFIRLAALFNEKARLFLKGRKNWKESLKTAVETGEKYIWFHCASLGEFEQGRPVIEKIKDRFPQYKIVLTFFSPSGYEIRKHYDKADVVFYLPIDTRRNARTFINIVRPEKVFFVKYEYWYFYISELKRQNIPLYIISAIFREKQFFFKKDFVGKWYRQMLFQFEHFFVQDEKSAGLLKSVGVCNCTVSGDTRFDRVTAIAGAAGKNPVVDKFKGQSPLIVAGSTWRPDEELLVSFINETDDVKAIIAPHEVTTANVNKLVQLLKKPSVRFSEVQSVKVEEVQVLIIDSIGLLSSLYRYGDVAYIGGGFGAGIHNILEAATFGLPVIFGPHYKKFREAVELNSLGGGFPIHNSEQLNDTLSLLLYNEKKRNESSEICKKYIRRNTGSSQIIINKVFNNF